MLIISPDQALIGGVLFLAGVVWKFWGDEIPSAAADAAGHAGAQAAAERRRLADTSREAGAGRGGLGALAARARAVLGGMRGPRDGSGPDSQVPAGSGPAGRIARQALNGARAGARRAAAAAAGRRDARRAGRGNPGTGTGPGRGPRGRDRGPGRGRGEGRGRDRGRQRGTGRNRRASLGVCDDCGSVVNRDSLERTPVERPGGTQWWQMCFLCRTRRTGGQSAPQGPAVTAPASGPALAAAPGPSRDQGTLPRPAGGTAGVTLPVPGQAAGSLPAGHGTAADPRTGLPAAPQAPAPESIPAGTAPALGGATAPVAAPAGTLPAGDGGQSAIPLPAGERQERILVPAGAPAGGTPGLPAGTQAQLTEGTSMPPGRQIAPRGGGMAARPTPGGVAVRNSRTHGGSTDNITVITAALRFAEAKQKEMSGDLAHAEVDEELRARIEAWLTQATAVRLFIRNGFDRIDQNLEPLLGAVERAGGPARVGSKWFHSDM